MKQGFVLICPLQRDLPTTINHYQLLSLKSPVAGNPVYIFGKIVYEIRKDDFIITGLEFR